MPSDRLLVRGRFRRLLAVAGLLLLLGACQPSGCAPAGTDWNRILPGTWVVTLPPGYAGQELWTFASNHHAGFSFWPRGFGVGNPLNNGTPGPNGGAKIWGANGDTLNVVTAFGNWDFLHLRAVNDSCFATESSRYSYQTLYFCWLQI